VNTASSGWGMSLGLDYLSAARRSRKTGQDTAGRIEMDLGGPAEKSSNISTH
jgi:hypothetical protein